ncbi:MAG: potassium channel family protein [Prochlorotrichaceae cyanobacterium]|jgi:voltage-gated potassium channel Kch
MLFANDASLIVVCGLGRTGYRIFSLLRQQGAEVLGLNTEPIPHETNIIVGDPRNEAVLRAALIHEARTLILTFGDDTLNLSILMQARILNPRIQVINRLFNSSLGEQLDRTLENHVTLSVSKLAAPVFSFAALGNLAIGQLQLFRQTWPIHEEFITLSHPWHGAPLASLWDDRSRMLIYYLPARDPVDLITAIEQGRCLQENDRLIIASSPRMQAQRRSWWELLRHKMGKTWQGLHRFQRYERPAFWVTTGLIAAIAIATFTYVYTDNSTQIVDALYFSVGMITGAGGNESVVESAPAIVKFFTVLMMLVGAAVVGIFYALLNDLVLGTHFQRIWDVAQVPQRHHYIICGLGGLGLKTAQQLQSQGYEVVVIEKNSQNRFLSTARSLKIPVIQGDASLAATLDAANVKRARGLLTVTSNDTTNLEVALSAKDLNPHLAVVVRNQDSKLAAMSQKIFKFASVLCPTELAAPSFAAVALGGQVLGNGMTANILWIALSTIITPEHPFYGHQVKDMAMLTDCVPLYLERAHATVHGWPLLDARLGPGDVLYMTIPAQQFTHIWRSLPLLREQSQLEPSLMYPDQVRKSMTPDSLSPKPPSEPVSV